MRIKLFLGSVLLLLFVAFSYAHTEPKAHQNFYYGFNYDPAHSALYNKGVALNQVDLMRQAVDQDFAQIKEIVGNDNTAVVKTFFSAYRPEHGDEFVNIPALAKKHGLKVLLGVFEFNNRDWTAGQVQTAIDAIKDYPDTIIGVVVGNEDVHGQHHSAMMGHIVQDITTIRNATQGIHLSMGFGTAQIGGHVDNMLRNQWNHQHVRAFFNAMDFVGVNIYAYYNGQHWGSGAQGSLVGEFNAIRQVLHQRAPNVKLVMGEEGWPSYSTGPSWVNTATIPAAQGYYAWWRERTNGQPIDIPNVPAGTPTTDNFSSFYFMFYDKVRGAHEADPYFGLRYISGEEKIAGQSPSIGLTLRLRNNLPNQPTSARNFIVFAVPKNPSWPANPRWKIHGTDADSIVNALAPGHSRHFKFTRDPERKMVDHFTVNLNIPAENYPVACTIDMDQLAHGRTILINYTPGARCGEA
jgi:exo-beta-1,3-glucanase (GH17 family)